MEKLFRHKNGKRVEMSQQEILQFQESQRKDTERLKVQDALQEKRMEDSQALLVKLGISKEEFLLLKNNIM